MSFLNTPIFLESLKNFNTYLFVPLHLASVFDCSPIGVSFDGQANPCMGASQILAKRGTNSKFKAEANHKSLVPKWKQSLILNYQICVHISRRITELF